MTKCGHAFLDDEEIPPMKLRDEKGRILVELFNGSYLITRLDEQGRPEEEPGEQ